MRNRQLMRILYLLIFLSSCSGAPDYKEYLSTIKHTNGHHVVLEDGKSVDLVGVYVPVRGEPNYLEKNNSIIRSRLINREVLVREVGERREPELGKTTLVEIFVDEKSINKLILSEGLGFYSEDFWNKKEQELFRSLQGKAESQSKGVWANREGLQVIAIRRNNQRFAYHPKSAEAKSIPETDRIYLYAPPPFYYEGISLAVFDEESLQGWLDGVDDPEFKEMRKTGWEKLKEHLDKKE